MTYQYRVRDPMGNIHTGSIEAAIGRGRHPATPPRRLPGARTRRGRRRRRRLFPRRVSKKRPDLRHQPVGDHGRYGHHALDGPGGHRRAGDQSHAAARCSKDLKEAVEGGEDFSAALARYPKYFDKTYVSLVKASEATGSLGPMLDRIAAYLRKELETRGKVRAAMAYPDGDDGPGQRRDDLPADLHPAEVHAAVQVEGDATAAADAGDDGPLRRPAGLLVPLARRRGGGGGGLPLRPPHRSRPQGPRLAEDQRPRSSAPCSAR